MAKGAVKKKDTKKISKKQVRQEVFAQLSTALSDYKTKLGEKKFVSNIKKASKILATDLARVMNKPSKASEPVN